MDMSENVPTPPVDDHIVALSQVLFAQESLDTVLRRVAATAVSVIGSCDFCGVTLTEQGRVMARVATNQAAERIDDAQYAAESGPCLEAVRAGAPRRVDNMAEETRWQVFADAARNERVVSSYSVPLLVGEHSVGALNLYSATQSFGADDELAASELASRAGALLANVWDYQRVQDLVGQLREALDSRDVIGQAKGIIMEREHCSSERAFEILRSVSQRRNIKLRDVARQVAGSGTWRDQPL